jgi:hypothetical protein
VLEEDLVRRNLRWAGHLVIDDKRITYRRRSITGLDVYSQAADGTDGPELLFGNGSPVWPASWTKDMRTLVVMQHDTVANGGDLWTLDVATKTLRPLVRTPASEFGGRLSPAVVGSPTSDVSAALSVCDAVPGRDKRWQVSAGGLVSRVVETVESCFFGTGGVARRRATGATSTGSRRMRF